MSRWDDHSTHARRIRNPVCGGCGYNVTGLGVDDRCPECGQLLAEVGVQPEQTGGERRHVAMLMALIVAGLLLASAGFAAFGWMNARQRAVPVPGPGPQAVQQQPQQQATPASAPLEESP